MAIIEAPDLVVTVDTAVAHLAGSEEAELQPGDDVEVTEHRTAATQ